jgi:hypothetical protein
MRIQTVQIRGDVTVNSLAYHMTNSYPEIRPHMQDPAVIISHTTPLSNSIKDNVVSACHVTSCIKGNTECHSLVVSAPVCILSVIYLSPGPQTSYPDLSMVFSSPYWQSMKWKLKKVKSFKQGFTVSDVWGSHGEKHEDGCLLGCYTMQSIDTDISEDLTASVIISPGW